MITEECMEKNHSFLRTKKITQKTLQLKKKNTSKLAHMQYKGNNTTYI